MYIFDKDILLKQKNEFDFEGVVASNWSINGNPNGGYLMAFLAAAMQKRVIRNGRLLSPQTFLSNVKRKKIQSNGGNDCRGKTVESVSGKPDSGRH
jgi:hypothetical protein